jgi:mono/diheme cytochrome c family protein
VIFAIVIPFWVLQSKGTEGAAAKPIASSDQEAQQLFQTNCGACHTLAAGGTDGVMGPDLDILLATNATKSQDTVDANCTRILSAIQGGLNGRMPKGILSGDQATEVANFVARNLNYVGDAPPATSGGSGSSTQPTGPITAASTKCTTSSG